MEKKRKVRQPNKKLVQRAKELGIIEFTPEEIKEQERLVLEHQQTLLDQILEDKEELERIKRIVHPAGTDFNNIYTLYKKYVDNKAKFPTFGCSKCPGSIVAYWKDLTTWYHNNKNKFDI